MLLRMQLIVATVLVALAAGAPALGEKRVALVIGNSAYKHAPALLNPKNDAEGVAAALKRLKFEVVFGFDLDEVATRQLLRSFSEKLEGFGKDDVAVLFYAGHGLQVNGRNYLVPVDAKLEKERDLDFQAIAFDFIQSLMEKTAQTNIVFLDSCRDNPLARTLARGMGTRSTGIGRGLAEMRGVNDTLIVYATNPGNVALDGKEKHSPFTDALLKYMEQPGIEVRHMVAQVRAAVIAATKGQQVPWESASLTRQVYFAAAAPGSPEGEAVFWQSIKDSRNIANFKAYLQRYPQGTFAELAKIRVAELERAAAEEERRKREEERKKADEARRRPESNTQPSGGRPDAGQLAGRTGSISRMAPERRAVMRIVLQFGAGGVLGVSCVAELADGGQAACFGQANGTGTWSQSGSTLCLSTTVLKLAERTCYQVSGSGAQLVLSGAGILAGVMLVR